MVGSRGTHWERSAGPEKMQVLGGNVWVLAGSLPLRQERAGLEGALARREDILVWWGTPARVGVGWCRGNGTGMGHVGL